MAGKLAIPQVSFKKSDFDDPSLTLFNQSWQNITNAINTLLGVGGTTTITSHLDLSGNKIQNIANPSSPQDAVSLAYADANYGPAQIRQQLDILGKSVMQSVRRLNDVNQRETTSSFLNNLMSTAPTANTSEITPFAPSGGTVSLTISAGVHQKVDGTNVAYGAFNDTVPLPVNYLLSSLTRNANTVTADVSTTEPFVVGDSVYIGSGAGLSDPSFVGTFIILTTPTTSQFTYQQIAGNATATGGTASFATAYYYCLAKNSGQLFRSGPYPSDTPTQRILASVDGTTILAATTVNSDGIDPLNSAAGATSPQIGSNVHILFRL